MSGRWMVRIAVVTAALVAATVIAAPGTTHPAGGAPASPSPARALAERLARSGRAEARFEKIAPDPLRGAADTVPGTLALEPPDRASISIPSTGERVTVRADGGEWLQPRLHQMMRLPPASAAVAGRWWAVLRGDSGVGLTFRRTGPGRYAVGVRAGEGLAADSARITFGASGLPSALEIEEEPGIVTTYRFSGWRFTRPRGRASFVQVPARGIAVVEAP